MEYLSGQTLEEALTDELTLVDYYADWCGPCKMLEVELEDIENIKIIKVDIDKHNELAQEKGIMTIPFVEIYKDKQLVTTFLGFKTKDEVQKILDGC